MDSDLPQPVAAVAGALGMAVLLVAASHGRPRPKNPNGHDCHVTTGVACAIGLGIESAQS
jgi:hypothetical protein